MSDLKDFEELWLKLFSGDIYDLCLMLQGFALPGHWPDLYKFGLLTSPWGIPTERARELVAWSRDSGRCCDE